MERSLDEKELFVNIRKSIRLLYEYQKRMQGTMFHIKSVLKLSPAGKIGVNKLFSYAPRISRKFYGETQLSIENWAWDYLYPMSMEYYLGKREIEVGEFRLSVIQVTDDGYYKAKKLNKVEIDTYTFSSPEESDSIVLFVFELKGIGTDWAKRWNREDMNKNLNKWITDDNYIIDDKTSAGNHFVVMKYPICRLLSKDLIDNVIAEVNKHIQELTNNTVNLIKKEP